MKLSKEQSEKVEHFLIKKFTSGCPLCHGLIKAKQTHALQLLSIENTPEFITGKDAQFMSIVVTVCENCKNVCLFDYDEIIKDSSI